MADYITYTSSLTATANSTAVTGSGTAFITDGLREGDWLWFLESAGPVGYPIASVESATALTLATAYKGSTGGSKSAIGMRRWDEEKASDTYRLVNSYIQSLEDTVSVSQAGIRYVYSTTTGMSDPGPGYFRFNNASPASATAMAFADESGETGNPDASAFINSFDDSTSAIKGYIYIKKAGSPQTFMIYAVTGLTDNSGWSQLAVTYITGNGSMVNNDAVRMEFYRVGNDGFENGLKYVYSTTTTDSDPGSGIFRFSSGTFASITNIYIDNADANSVTVTTLLDSWDDSTNTANRGTLRFQKVGDPTVFREFTITGAITDGTGYRKIPVSPSVSNGTWTNGNSFIVLFTRSGNAGASGYIPGYKFTYSTTTTDSDPGAGTVRMNNATFGSITQLFVDNTDSGGTTITTWLDSLDDSSATVRGILRFEKQDDPTIYREFQVTGSVTDGTGYRKITVTPLVSGGSWTNGIAINATFSRTGNNGADGYAPGFRYTYSTTTTDSDPGAGTMRLNNGTHSSATFAYIDNADAAGATVTTWLDGLDDSTQTNHRGYLRIQKASDPAIYREYVVTGAVVDGTGYRKIPLSHVASAGVLSNSDAVVLTFSRTGNVGTNGLDGVQSGYRFTFSTTTTDSDPGGGFLRFNNATFGSVTSLFVDNTDVNSADVTTWLDSLDNATSAVRGTLRIEKIGDATVYREFNVTGAVTDGTGYRKVVVAPVVSNGTLSNNDTIAVTFFRAGDAGIAVISDGDKGDITTSAAGTTWTIDASAVTNAKMASMGQNTIKGRISASTGAPEDLSGAQARAILSVREALSANRTYYVRNDGNNSNDGLTNSSGGAFATLQKAYDTIVGLDLKGYTATIQYGVSGQTLTGALNATVPVVGGNIIIDLGGSTLSTTGNALSFATVIKATVQNGKVAASSGNCIAVGHKGADVTIGASMTFGACGIGHITSYFGVIRAYSNYTVDGSAAYHFLADQQGAFELFSYTTTLSGTPNFGVFCLLTGGAYAFAASLTYSGSATGPRYSSTQNAIINTFGGGASYFPGNVAGSTATGGLYL
jgi:hypothetical protein